MSFFFFLIPKKFEDHRWWTMKKMKWYLILGEHSSFQKRNLEVLLFSFSGWFVLFLFFCSVLTKGMCPKVDLWSGATIFSYHCILHYQWLPWKGFWGQMYTLLQHLFWKHYVNYPNTHSQKPYFILGFGSFDHLIICDFCCRGGSLIDRSIISYLLHFFKLSFLKLDSEGHVM